MGKAPITYAEYIQQVESKLSWLEKMSDGATGLDERVDITNKLLIETVKLISAGLKIQLPPAPFPGYPPYNVRTFLLDTARVAPGEEMQLPGDTITAYTDGTLVGCLIRMDEGTNDAIPLSEFNPYHYRAGFQRFYLETSAQAGKYLRLHIGREAGAEAASQTITVQATTPSAKAALFNTALPGAEASWLSSNIVPTHSPSHIRIYVCASVAGVFRVARMIETSVVTENMNAGVALAAGCGYMFEVPWRSGDSVNFRYSVTAGTINRFLVDELT